MDFTKLSRAVSHALRHEPWLYELELDAEGWVPARSLIAALRDENPSLSALAEADLEQMIARSEKKRHELRDGKIRALYGHSIPQKLVKNRAEPPALLYLGNEMVWLADAVPAQFIKELAGVGGAEGAMG